MFRLWGKLFKNQSLLKDYVYESNEDDTITHHVKNGLIQICSELDISHPLWLSLNIKDFTHYQKTRFRKDNFMENVDFDYLEIEWIE